MATNKGGGWKVLLSLSMIAAVAVLPYLGVKLFMGGDDGKEPGPAPLSGNSKAVSIEPIEGIRIAAVENAMDKDREISFDFVDEKQWNRAVKALKNEDTTPLCAFEFSAGMAPDEHIPGTFDISVDLDEMGIPPVLYDRMQVWRVADDGSYYRYSSRVKGNQLCFKSNQNSAIMLCLGAALVLYGDYKFVHFCQEASLQEFFEIVEFAGDPVIGVPITDDEGDFTLYFSFYTTERPGGTNAFMENEEKAMARLKILEREADRKVGEQADLAVSGRKLKMLERWQLRKQRDEAKKKIDREAILQELVNTDPEMKALNSSPDAPLPTSIQKTIEMVKRANYYLNHIAQVKPLTFNQEVYLVNSMVLNTDGGRNVTRVGGKPFLLINADKMMDPDPNTGKRVYTSAPAKGQSTLLTVAHELFHARQQMNYCDVRMGMYAAESTAAVLEVDAARWFYKNGYISANVDAYGNGGLQLSPRQYWQVFARPLDDITVSDKYTILDLGDPGRLYGKTMQELQDASDVGYTLAYVIEAVREYANNPDRSMHYVVEQYPKYGKRFSEMVRSGMPLSEQAFDNAWLWFCNKHMYTLYNAQYTQEQTDVSHLMTECYTSGMTLNEADAAHDLPMLQGKNYYFRTWHVEIDDKSEKEYNLFITNRFNKNQVSPYVHFFATSDKKGFRDDGNNGENRYLKHPGACRFAAAVTSYSKQENLDDYWAVALFKPRAVKIVKLFEDRIELKLPPISRILLQKGLVTGAIITYYPKDGGHLEKKVLADDFANTVYWDIEDVGKDGGQFGLTVQWYYEEDANTVYKSPESDVVYHRMGEEVEEEEKPGEGGYGETEGPGLEGGYWRLVRTEVDDSEAKQKSNARLTAKAIEDKNNGWVSGSNGSYSSFVEWWAFTDWVHEKGGSRATSYRVINTWVRNIDITVPKEHYKPAESVAFDVCHGPVSIEGDGDQTIERLPHGSVCLYFRSRNGEYDTVNGFVSCGKSAWDDDNPLRNTGQVTWTYKGVLPEEKYVDNNNYWGFVVIHEVIAPYGRMTVKYHYEWVERAAAPKKSGHWHLTNTYVNNARTGSSSMSGQKSHYTVNGRSILFDPPKTDYQAGERVSLRIVHGKVKKTSGNYPWGEGDMSTVMLGECTSTSGSVHPRFDAGEAISVYQGVTPLEGSPGEVGFWIQEKVNNGEDFLTTSYYYEWVED